MSPVTKPKIQSKKTQKPKIRLGRETEIGRSEGTYQKVFVGKRGIWVSKRGVNIIKGLKLEDKTESQIYKMIQKFDLRSQAQKKETFRQNMQNAIESSNATEEQKQQLTDAINSMDDNELSEWSRENKDMIEEVLDYKEELGPAASQDIENSRQERTARIDELIEGLRQAGRITD